jgi:hypothetical protein
MSGIDERERRIETYKYQGEEWDSLFFTSSVLHWNEPERLTHDLFLRGTVTRTVTSENPNGQMASINKMIHPITDGTRSWSAASRPPIPFCK